MNRFGVLGAAVAAAALVAALWYVLVPAETRHRLAPADPAAISAGFVEGTSAARDAPAAGAVPAIARTEEDGKGWFATDTVSTVSGRYHAMRDKRRFVDLAMKTGGGAYLAYFMIADARCQPVNGKPGTIAAQRRRMESAGSPTARQKAEARRYEGCEGFESSPTGESDMLPLLTTLFGASDPAARALRLMREEDPEAIRREAGALLGEDDPVLVAMLVDSITRIVLVPARDGSTPGRSPGPARLATHAERGEEDSAWTLALCRLGIECRMDDSPPWINACLDSGHCSEDFAESLARASHKARFDAVLARSEVIEKAVRNRDWRSLGF